MKSIEPIRAFHPNISLPGPWRKENQNRISLDATSLLTYYSNHLVEWLTWARQNKVAIVEEFIFEKNNLYFTTASLCLLRLQLHNHHTGTGWARTCPCVSFSHGLTGWWCKHKESLQNRLLRLKMFNCKDGGTSHNYGSLILPVRPGQCCSEPRTAKWDVAVMKLATCGGKPVATTGRTKQSLMRNKNIIAFDCGMASHMWKDSATCKIHITNAWRD